MFSSGATLVQIGILFRYHLLVRAHDMVMWISILAFGVFSLAPYLQQASKDEALVVHHSALLLFVELLLTQI